MPIHHYSYVAREASPARQCYADRKYHGARKTLLGTDTSRSKYYICYVPGPTCRGPPPMYVPPLDYKREGTQRYRFIQTQAILDTTQAHEQYNTQWSSVLRSGGPNHSKLLRVIVCSSPNSITGKTLRPLLIIGFWAGAFRHPAEDFLSDNYLLPYHRPIFFTSILNQIYIALSFFTIILNQIYMFGEWLDSNSQSLSRAYRPIPLRYYINYIYITISLLISYNKLRVI
jgi:hypothetical protein